MTYFRIDSASSLSVEVNSMVLVWRRSDWIFKLLRAGCVGRFLEWLLPLLVQVLVAGPLYHPPLLTSQNMTSTTKSWVDQIHIHQ